MNFKEFFYYTDLRHGSESGNEDPEIDFILMVLNGPLMSRLAIAKHMAYQLSRCGHAAW